MLGMLFAERAILLQHQPVRIVLFIFQTVIISVLAFRALKRNLGPCRFRCHIQNSIQKNYTLSQVRIEILPYFRPLVNPF